MALAKYFSKDLLAINRLINTDQDLLTDKLNETVISIAFDENCINTFEGNCGIELIVRLLSRLYPKIKIIDLSSKFDDKVEEYNTLSRKINSQIEIVDNSFDEDILIVVGDSKNEITSKGLIIYFGSDNWVSKYSVESIQKFGNSKNPFGAGLSACITASNVFRHIFKDYLKFNDLDSSFELSSFSLDTRIKPEHNPILSDIEFSQFVIAGIGAIGNGVVWALSKLGDLKGEIHLVDDEQISLSNLQRYILLEETHVNEIKVEIAKHFFNQVSLTVVPFKCNWDKYLNTTNNWIINCVAVGIDNTKDRIGIQSTLPLTIFNAFTETELLAITRHKDFINSACLSCSYIPLKKQKDFINEVADNCNIPQHAEIVKLYYNTNIGVGTQIPMLNNISLLNLIAEANKISIDDLNQFKEMTVNQFYSDFVCGGVILQFSKTDNSIKNVDAPLAFQSAMAGILLAAELVKHAINSDFVQEQRTDIYHLSPIVNGENPYHRMLVKDETGRCVCSDSDFKNRYIEKWKK